MWSHISSSSFKATSFWVHYDLNQLMFNFGGKRGLPQFQACSASPVAVAENVSIVSSLFPWTIALDQSAWEEKSISCCKTRSVLNGKKNWTKSNDTISGSSEGLQPVKKGKRPLPPGGIPDPKHPRLWKDEGKACVFSPYLTLGCIMRASFSHG